MLLSSYFRQESLHYISTYYLIGFIVIIPTGISTLHLYFLSHWFYCYNSDRNLYTISLSIISSVLWSLFRQESLHYISTSYLIGFIITYHIISHPSYHLPILRVLSYTNFSHRCYHLVSHALPNPNYMYSSITIIKCRYHMTFRRKPLEFTPGF